MDMDAPAEGAPYTIEETQSGIQVLDRHGRIMEHFDNFDPKAGEKAAKLLKKLNTDPKTNAKYNRATTSQKAMITALGKRQGFFKVDEKGKSKPTPAFSRFIKGITGKTVRSKLTYGEAKKLLEEMGKRGVLFRGGDKISIEALGPAGMAGLGYRKGDKVTGSAEGDVNNFVGEVIHVNAAKGKVTVQFKNKITGATSSKIFSIEELAGLTQHQLASEEMTETIRQTQDVKTPKDEVLGQRENDRLKKYWGKVKRKAHGWYLGQLRVGRMMEWLDGYTKGANWHNVFLPMNEASITADNAINARVGDLQTFMMETFGPEKMRAMFTGQRTPVQDPKFADKISLSPSERIGYYVLKQNPDGLRRLLKGNLGSFGNPNQALKAVLESVTPEEQQIGDWALQQLAERYPDANNAAIIALGRELTPADNYFPIYAPADQTDWGQQLDALSELEENVGGDRTSMEITEAQERSPTSTGPVEADFFRSYLHNIARVERFIHMAPAVNQTQNLYTTKGKSTEVNDWTGKLLAGLRRNGMVYAIGYNIPSVLRQTLSLGNAMAIDPLMPKHVLNNIPKTPQAWKDYQSMDNFVMGKSEMMRARNFDRIESALNDASSTEKRMMGEKEYSQKALGWIRWMDRHTTVIAWQSLFDSAKERNMSDDQAVAFADEGISKTQPMGNARDLPDFFRGGPLTKLLTTFQNQINQNYNFWTHDIAGELKAGKISKKTAGYRVMFSSVIPALLFGMVGRGGPPEDWGDAATDLALYPLGAPFLVGRLITNIAKGFGSGATSIAEIAPTEFGKMVSSAYRGDTRGFVIHGTKFAGSASGRMPAQAIRAAEGAYDLSQNETDDWRRLIYSEWALSQGNKGGKSVPVEGQRKMRARKEPRKRRLRRR
jgi:hypothetical protein